MQNINTGLVKGGDAALPQFTLITCKPMSWLEVSSDWWGTRKNHHGIHNHCKLNPLQQLARREYQNLHRTFISMQKSS